MCETVEAEWSGAETEIDATAGCIAIADLSSGEEGHDVAPTGLGVGSFCPTGTLGENSNGAALVNEPSMCVNSTCVHDDMHDILTHAGKCAAAAGGGNAVTDVACMVKWSGVEVMTAHCCSEKESLVCAEEAYYVK